MRSTWRSAGRWGLAIGLAVGFVGCVAGCGVANGPYQFMGSPFTATGPGDSLPSGPGGSGRTSGSGLAGNDRTPVDPCSEPQSRKFVRISMRNLSADYVHYFLVMIAFVKSDTYPTGAVCPADIPLYTSFGYTLIPANTQVEFGNYCVEGPALIYFHLAGQFQSAGGAGSSQLASAIAPALGSSPTYDDFFNSAGAPVPVPDVIFFYNPGSGEGGRLKISRNAVSPCSQSIQIGDPNCAQDAFYYVDSQDRMTGSTALGAGSGRRVPSEIQGTACECLGLSLPFQQLAPSRLSASAAACNEFFRGGKIDYVFIRDDKDPPYPQLVWRVTDSSGGMAHDYDQRANVP